MTARVLLLAGTAEARALASALAEMSDIEVTASLAGVTGDPAPIAGQVRSGGFGGAAGLLNYLKTERVVALVDATHPFAAQMSMNATLACAAAAIPRLRLVRAAWEPVGDWREVADIAAASDSLPGGARALITTGRKELVPFAARIDVTGVVRFIEPVAGLPGHLTQIIARPPFSLEAELALMRDERITHLVSKNAGGTGRAKLDAAAQLGLPIVMVARPDEDLSDAVHTVEDAVAWVRECVAAGA